MNSSVEKYIVMQGLLFQRKTVVFRLLFTIFELGRFNLSLKHEREILEPIPNTCQGVSFMKYALISILIMMLSACATMDKVFPGMRTFTVPYKEPDGMKTTRLRVVTDSTVRLFPGRDCYDWHEPKAGMVASRALLALANDKTFNDRKIGIPQKGEMKDSSEVFIKPNEPLVVIYLGNGECMIAGTFVPEDNSDYQLQADKPWLSSSCQMSLSKVTVDQTTKDILYSSIKLNSAYECKK